MGREGALTFRLLLQKLGARTCATWCLGVRHRCDLFWWIDLFSLEIGELPRNRGLEF